MTSIVSILEKIKTTSGSNAKKEILLSHNDNLTLKTVLKMSLDPFTPFHVVKVPNVEIQNSACTEISEVSRWEMFFKVANLCAKRVYTGNEAITKLHAVFSNSTEGEDKWMRKILKKHLAIGVSTKTVNKVFPNLIPEFNVSLAQKFEEKRIKGRRICIEPKLDGIRCFAVVSKGQALLYARSGKLITNFDETIGSDLSVLQDGCYDGEIMGEDFISLMRQAYRKDNTDVSTSYLALFDFVSVDEWSTRITSISTEDRYSELVRRVHGVSPDSVAQGLPLLRKPKYLKVVQRQYCESRYNKIKEMHDVYVAEGYEGAMIKDLDAPYKFGRGFEVMKLKNFHDVDLNIVRLLEGTGRHSGKLGSVVVVYNGVEVQVGSGFSDSLREAIWNDSSSFIGRIIEVRYQEVTPDGSLRFPTFVCFRNDRS